MVPTRWSSYACACKFFSRRHGRPLHFLLYLIVFVVLLSAVAPTPVRAAELGRRLERRALVSGHRGRWLVDAYGRVVILHGVNMVVKLPPYDPAVLGFGDDDAAFLASEGFNTVRLGIIYKALESTGAGQVTVAITRR